MISKVSKRNMCLTIPVKIISKKKNKAQVVFRGTKKEIDCRLVKAKVGDYVTLQNNFAIKKISK